MKRKDLEHLIRAAAAITNSYEIVVIGSQSILGEHPDAPEDLLMSIEADLYPLDHPELSDLIDGAMGELSFFDKHYGYHAQGVGPETAVLPLGWKDRLVRIQNKNTDSKIGYCLEAHDLATSKLAAGREKDYDFVSGMIRQGYLEQNTFLKRISSLMIPVERKDLMIQWVLRAYHSVKKQNIDPPHP